MRIRNPMTGNRARTRDLRLAAGAATAALVVYGLLLEIDVGAWDTAEMQTTPRILGIAHRPTYPLFTLLGAVWSRIPFGDAVVRMNLMSAVLFAAATGLIALIGRRLGVRAPIAALGSLVFAFSTASIASATQIEVQSLHLVLLTALLLQAHRLLTAPSRNGLVAAGVIVGLGMAHHGLMTLTGPPLLVAIVLARRSVLFRPRVIAAGVVATLAPLAIYAYPVITYDRSRFVAVDRDAGWLDIFLARGGIAGTMGKPSSIGIWFADIGRQLELLVSWSGVAPVLLALVGVVALARRARWFTMFITGAAAIASYAQANATDINDRYLITVVASMALFAMVGAEELVRLTLSRFRQVPRREAVAMATLAFAVVPGVLAADALAEGRRGDDTNRRNGERVLASLPPDCVLWAYWDVRTTLTHLQVVDGLRRDVEILDHRSTPSVGSSFAARPAGVYFGVQNDPTTTGRPVCFIAHPSTAPVNPDGLRLVPLGSTITPWGRTRLDDRFVYLIEPATD
jgi:hypothetical protein